MGPLGTLWDLQEPYVTLQDLMGTCGTLFGMIELCLLEIDSEKFENPCCFLSVRFPAL